MISRHEAGENIYIFIKIPAAVGRAVRAFPDAWKTCCPFGAHGAPYST